MALAWNTAASGAVAVAVAELSVGVVTALSGVGAEDDEDESSRDPDASPFGDVTRVSLIPGVTCGRGVACGVVLTAVAEESCGLVPGPGCGC